MHEPGPGQMMDAAALARAAQTLAVDAVAATVVGAMRQDGIEPVLLKGPVLAQWLYGDHEVRGYCDADVLVAPDAQLRAERVLTQLGFKRYVREWEPRARRIMLHDATWVRDSDGGIIDLHRTLPGVRHVSPERAWACLAPHTIEWEMPSPGGTVRVLDESARALLVALHAGHHLSGEEAWAPPLGDLERAVERLPDDIWAQAADLAAELRAAGQMSRALHAAEGGAVIAARLELPPPSSGVDEIVGFERMAYARGARARIRVIAHAIAPAPDYMRWTSALARRGTLGLIVAYLVRPLQFLGRAPRALRVWLQLRRTGSSG